MGTRIGRIKRINTDKSIVIQLNRYALEVHKFKQQNNKIIS